MLTWWEKNFATCDFGDRRLNERAFVFRLCSRVKDLALALSEIFNEATVLKRAYEFLLIQK